MKKSLFEQMGGTYHQEGDYFLPDLSVPELPSIGIWGQRRKQYLKEHRQTLYTATPLSGKLNDHLFEVDKQAEAIFFSWSSKWLIRKASLNNSRPKIRWSGLDG